MIQSILHPEDHTLAHLGEYQGKKLAPVQYRIWKGGKPFSGELLELDVMPYDTIDMIKHRLVSAMYDTADRAYYTHRHVFIGFSAQPQPPPNVNVQQVDSAEEKEQLGQREQLGQLEQQGLYPLDYLWFSPQSDRPSDAFVLSHPADALSQPDSRFVTSNGILKPLTFTSRGRLTVEQVFLQGTDAVTLPIMEVIPFHVLYETFQRQRRRQRGSMARKEDLTDAEFNGIFYPYFPELTQSKHDPTADDAAYAEKIHSYITARNQTMNVIQELIDNVQMDTITLPAIQLDGIGQIMFTWKKPATHATMDGCAEVFYRVPVKRMRPFMRLLPGMERSAGITKLHVEGVIPIPTLIDPMVLEQWAKEESNTPEIDFCIVKYIQRVIHGIPYYGTVHLLNDGSMNLMLQPTLLQKMLERELFQNMEEQMEQNVLTDLSYSLEDMRLHEMNAVVKLTVNSTQTPFTASMIERRLPLFHSFFVKIQPVLPPNQNPMISLRYKAMSQYEVQNKIMVYISQFMGNVVQEEPAVAVAEEEAPEDEEKKDPLIHRLVQELQDEFQISKTKALEAIQEYMTRKQEFTIRLPKEGEFITTFHPGIDIYIYKNHPYYTVHIHRIESDASYHRIGMLLRYLFLDEDSIREFISPLPSKAIMKQSDLPIEEATKREQKVAAAAAASMYDNEDLYADFERERQRAEQVKAQQQKERGREEAETEEVDISPFSYLLKRLQEADPYLFGSNRPELKISSDYSTRCQKSPQMRQPVVMKKDEFEQMRERYSSYERRGLLHWRIYPIVGDKDPEPVPKNVPVFTVMRYASKERGVLHYYLCPEYFCILDNTVLIPSEFRGSERLVDGTPKRPNTCPFCGKGVITDMRTRTKGDKAVIHRPPHEEKPLQSYIGFITKKGDEVAKPCCFGKEQVLRGEDKEDRFGHLRDALGMRRLAEDADDAPAASKVGLRDVKKIPAADLFTHPYKVIEYAAIFKQYVQTTYMLDANKDPDPGRIALIPPVFDAYFQQNSPIQMIQRGKNQRPSLKPSATGFLRMGVDNTVYESLLGAITPILGLHSIQEVKDLIRSTVTAPIFANMGFGNYVTEFFSPTDYHAMPSNPQELRQWASNELAIELSSTNQHALIRLYNAYYRFLQFMMDPNQRKDVRHIQPMLAEPGLFSEYGIQLILMDVKDKRVVIKCPTYGLSDRHRSSDFVFLSREFRTRDTIIYPHYEYYFYSVGRAAQGEKSEKHRILMGYSQDRSAYFAPIIRERVEEYMTRCRSHHRALYTEQHLPQLHPLSMIPLSSLLNAFPTGSMTRLELIVKDVANHVAGVTVKDRSIGRGYIPIPVVDDGVNAYDMREMEIEMNWRSVKGLAAVETILRFYIERMATIYRPYRGYHVAALIRHRPNEPYVALQLANGLYLPVGPVQSQEAFDQIQRQIQDAYGQPIPEKEIDEWEWEMNLEFLGQVDPPSVNDEGAFEEQTRPMDMEEKCKEKPHDLLTDTSIHAFEEYYQTFRLMVSNWLTSSKTTENIREMIQSILFDSTLPDYERRYRLYLLLADEFRGMLDATRDPEQPPVLSLYRRDCRLIDRPDQCTEMCGWNVEKGKCLLHVRKQTPITDDRAVDTAEMYTKRVIDELVRFPYRRKQLMYEGEISRMIRMEDPLRVGDQYYIPESSFTWTTLLRLEWTKHAMERPRHYEEMTRSRDEYDQEPETDYMPAVLVGYLTSLRGAQEADQPLPFLYKKVTAMDEPLYPLMSLLGVDFDSFGISEKEQSTLRQLNRGHLEAYTIHTQNAIGVIDLTRPDDPKVQFIRHVQREMHHEVNVIIHYMENGVVLTGMLFNVEGGAVLSADTFPPALRDAWEAAIRVSSKTIPKPIPELDQLLQPKALVPHVAPMSIRPASEWGDEKRELAPPPVKKVRDPRGRRESDALVAPHLQGVELERLDPQEHVKRKPRRKKVAARVPELVDDQEKKEKRAQQEKDEDEKRKEYVRQPVREEDAEEKTDEQLERELQEKRDRLKLKDKRKPKGKQVPPPFTDDILPPPDHLSPATASTVPPPPPPLKTKAKEAAADPLPITGAELIRVKKEIDAKKHRVPRLHRAPEFTDAPKKKSDRAPEFNPDT